MSPLLLHINVAVSVVAASFGTATDSSPTATGLRSSQSLLRSYSLLGELHPTSSSGCLSGADIVDSNNQLHYDCRYSSRHLRGFGYCGCCCLCGSCPRLSFSSLFPPLHLHPLHSSRSSSDASIFSMKGFIIHILLRSPPHYIDLLQYDVGFRIHISSTAPHRFHRKSLDSSLLRLNK